MFPTIWNEFDMLTDAFLDVNDDNSNIKTLATFPQSGSSAAVKGVISGSDKR